MRYSSKLPKSLFADNQVVGDFDFVASDSLAIEMITNDPFVAPQDHQRPVPKPVEEIVRNLNGYRIMESPIPKSQIELPFTVQPEGMPQCKVPNEPAVSKKMDQVQLAPVSLRFTVTSVQQLQANSAGQPITACKLPEIQSSDPSTAVPIDSTAGAKRFLSNEDHTEPPMLVDIRDFATAEPQPNEVSLPEPEPIPGAFQFDPDFFEYHATQRHLNQLDALDRELTHLTASEITLDPQAPISNQIEPSLESLQVDSSDSSDSELDEFGVIYAQNQQIIYVDGNDGFEFIDLSSFSIDQASFQANRIRIRTESHEFEVDYRNVTHVLFANGQEVELACEEEYE